jgi:hypothetical protein
MSHLRHRLAFILSTLSLPLASVACSDSETRDPSGSSNDAGTCKLEQTAFEVGDPNGHDDPFGAKAEKQARAGRIRDASAIAQPAHGRQRIESGDFVLVNDKISVVIEDKGLSDGYARFGGEILSIDKVGDDGKPLGLSYYVETLYGLSIEMIDPTSVSVLKDGSDGGEAVVRVTGPLKGIPFLADGPIAAAFQNRYGWVATQDYVLRPGDEKVLLRLGVINPTNEKATFGLDSPTAEELIGFFHSSRAQLATPESGFASPSGNVAFAAFDAGPWGFAWKRVGSTLEYGLAISGFELFWGPGFEAPKCSSTIVDQMEIIAGGPDYDGLLAAVRRAGGETPWRAITGTLTDSAGAPVEGAFIHELDAKGAYLSRVRTAADGTFTIHAPAAAVELVAQKRGYQHAGVTIAQSEDQIDLSFEPHATLHVVATDEATGDALPVRVQVIPTTALPGTPETFGAVDEVEGRLHQEFAVTGDASLIVPPGEHRVIVSRGYEWELFDQTVTVAPGETLELAPALAHSVDTADVMCADFHIHSFMSADSSDPIEHKVKGAIADGLDIPVSSEHEWIVDFQPVIQSLGLERWAFGAPSQELTTFSWGHFGVVPLTPRPGRLNNGAIEWVGQLPGRVFEHVHEQPENPVLIVNHPSDGAFSSYFSMANFDEETGRGSGELWSDRFDAVEVTNDSDFESNRSASVAHWFSLLNHGYKMWAVGSSDSHSLRTSPVGYPRTCMFFGHDDPSVLSANAVRDALASGGSTISGGLFMWVSGPNGERPGQTVHAAGNSVSFTVRVETASWIDADTIETIVNGETVSTEALEPMGAGPSKRFVNQISVPIDPNKDRNWVVFHAKGETDLAPLHPGRRPFGFSNPVFITKN